jgi:hypothetical protein
MRKFFTIILAATLVLSFAMVGCTKKAASFQEAIKASEAMQTVQQKVDYLIGQANAFYNSKDFQSTVDVANYVLQKLDKNSQQAQDLLQKAKSQIQAAVKSGVTDVKSKFGIK